MLRASPGVHPHAAEVVLLDGLDEHGGRFPGEGEDPELPHGIRGLWLAVIVQALLERRWGFFAGGANFHLACECAGISAEALRARVKQRKAKQGNK